MSPQRKGNRDAQLPLFPQAADDFEFFVRESARARSLSIRIHVDGRVEIVAPRRTSPAEVQEFVTRHREWILSTSEEQKDRFPRQDRALPERIELRAIGHSWPVVYEPATRDAWRVTEKEGRLVARGHSGKPAGAYDQLRRWLAGYGRRHLVPWVHELSVQTGLAYRKIQIRGQRTRWGSYSSSGTVSLNYCLLFLAPEIVRYLLVHELCHSRHMNHSKRYWKLVERYEPDFRVLDNRLSDAWADVPGWVFAHK